MANLLLVLVESCTVNTELKHHNIFYYNCRCLKIQFFNRINKVVSLKLSDIQTVQVIYASMIHIYDHVTVYTCKTIYRSNKLVISHRERDVAPAFRRPLTRSLQVR